MICGIPARLMQRPDLVRPHRECEFVQSLTHVVLQPSLRLDTRCRDATKTSQMAKLSRCSQDCTATLHTPSWTSAARPERPVTCGDAPPWILRAPAKSRRSCKVPRTRSRNLGCTSTAVVEMQPRLNSCRDAANLARRARVCNINGTLCSGPVR